KYSTMMVARCTDVPQKAFQRAQVSYQSQGQPTRNSPTPVKVQTTMVLKAHCHESLVNAQIATIGKSNQAWILVSSARDQNAPALMIVRVEAGGAVARTPARRAVVQNRLRNVSRAAR